MSGALRDCGIFRGAVPGELRAGFCVHKNFAVIRLAEFSTNQMDHPRLTNHKTRNSPTYNAHREKSFSKSILNAFSFTGMN